jgi:hypothetical protein
MAIPVFSQLEEINGELRVKEHDALKRTDAERVAEVTPINYAYSSGDSRRMSPDTTGTEDVTSKLQGLLDAAGIAANSADGQVTEVTVYPGTYKVTRLYMNYSNVWLRLMPGAVIQQTRTGITDSNTTGVAPAYAAIHINPLTYVANPASAVTAIENVKIYGGGSVLGPYITAGAYDGFTMGIVSNDCHSCVIDGIYVYGFRAENILLNPSGWNTCRDLKILHCEVEGGGEVGINNGRDFVIDDNYVHDSWMQNGLGGNGDGGQVTRNRIRGMYGAGMTVGGSGARDINECRNVVYSQNVVQDCNVGTGAGYLINLFDDGATTTPKVDLRFCDNIFSLNQGNILMAADFNSGRVEIDGNTLTGLQGTDATLFAVVDGTCAYRLRNNSFLLGNGNAVRCVDILGGTPHVILDEGNFYDPLIATDIQGPGDFDIRHEYHSSFTATLVNGGGATATMRYSKKGSHVTLYLAGLIGTATGTPSVSGLPAVITPARNHNFTIPVTDNGTNALGILQVKTDSTLALFKDINAGAMTGSGTSGITGPYAVSYVLN